jgi:hypothetical protein
MMKKAFFINGGIGRVLCALPALEWYKLNKDPDVIIVAEGWADIFLTSPIIRNNVYPIGHKGLFEDKLRDCELVSPEPYRLNAYFNQKCNLIQAFDILINDLPEIPKTKEINIAINKNDQCYGQNLVMQVKQQLGKEKVIVFQPFGSTARKEGNMVIDPSGRSFEIADILTIIERLNKHYAVILMTEIDISSNVNLGVAVPQASLLQWMGIVDASDYFLGCDSMGQHYAHALEKPATVVLGSTYPENISYPDDHNFTIIDNGKEKRMYSPIRITANDVADRVNETLMVLDDKSIDKIIKSITDKLGKIKQKPETLQAISHIHNADCEYSTIPHCTPVSTSSVIAPPFSKKQKN